jgi:hypothetical protein
MACKGSEVQIPSAPPRTTRGGGGESGGYRWSTVQVRVRMTPSTAAQLPTIEAGDPVDDMGDLADLGRDEHVRAQHLALTSSASDPAIAVTWPMGSQAVDDAQEAQAVDGVAPEH